MANGQASIPILVVGAGAWGTALAVQLCARAQPGLVSLYARDAEQAHLLQASHENKKYLQK